MKKRIVMLITVLTCAVALAISYSMARLETVVTQMLALHCA
jgi:hypothetical protein